MITKNRVLDKPSRALQSNNYHLLGHHDNSFYRESSVAVVKEILQARTQKVNDEYVMQAFLTEIVHIGYSR